MIKMAHAKRFRNWVVPLAGGGAVLVALGAGSLGFASPETGALSVQAAPQAILPDSPARSEEAKTTFDADVQARARKLIANQHRDDSALDEYERVERHVDRTGGDQPRMIEDRTYRVVPTGGGTMKILLKDGATDTNAADYRRQLQAWEGVLQMMVRPGDSRAKTASEKYTKRQKERADLVDSMNDAFIAEQAGHDTLNGRVCDIFQLDPNPNYHPRSIFEEALGHVTVKLWVDQKEDQLVRGEAHVIRDFGIGAGILGKLYKGGSFSMEQAEVAPGIWLPSRYQYDFSGRKFVVSFEEHQLIEASHYRRVGPPQEALATVENELASGKDPYDP